MAEKIQIDAGHNQSITALHQVPAERSTKRLDETLVVMSHGFPGNMNHLGHVYGDIEFLMGSKSYHSLRFDFRGCGESDGRPQDFTLGAACEDFQAVMYWARSKGYSRFFFIGDGLGASIAIMNMDMDVKGLAVLWPALDLDVYCKKALGVTDISDAEVKAGYIEKGGHKIGIGLLRELSKIDLQYALKEIFVPSIILHGAQDEIIPVQQLDLARRYIPAKRIEITIFQDGTHGLVKPNHRHAMMFQLQQFIDKYI